MPRYFFNVEDEDHQIKDLEGIELDGLDAVREEALQSARQVMSEDILSGRRPSLCRDRRRWYSRCRDTVRRGYLLNSSRARARPAINRTADPQRAPASAGQRLRLAGKDGRLAATGLLPVTISKFACVNDCY